MRNLYDGYITKHTGSGVNKQYENCHVTLIAGATPMLKKEYLIHQQLGSRELIFDTDAVIQDNDDKMIQAWENEEYEKQMKAELQEVVSGYLDNVDIKEIEGEKTIVYELKVGTGDMGKIIGRGGKTVNAIRTIIAAASMKQGKRAILEILE